MALLVGGSGQEQQMVVVWWEGDTATDHRRDRVEFSWGNWPSRGFKQSSLCVVGLQDKGTELCHWCAGASVNQSSTERFATVLSHSNPSFEATNALWKEPHTVLCKCTVQY